MSFSSDAKAELCRVPLTRRCCARAEAYGVLLYCNTFSANEIRVITASPEFASRLPKLFRKAFGISFDVMPEEGTAGKMVFAIRAPEKIDAIMNAFGFSTGSTPPPAARS